MGKQKLSQQQRMEVCDRYQQGENTTQLGKVFGVNPNTIRKILKGAGVPRRSHSEANGGVPKAKHSEVCERYLAGENTVRLGKAFNVNSTTICRILQDAGVPRRSRGGRPVVIPKSKHLEIWWRYLAGASTTQIGKVFGVSPSAIRKILKGLKAAADIPHQEAA